MFPAFNKSARRWSCALYSFIVAVMCFAFALPLWGGGSGLNVVVVVNQSSSNSVALGNYYAERRQVPPENILRIHWTGSLIEWTTADFTNTLQLPLQAMISQRGLSNQVDYVVLSMAIPYRTVQSGGGANGTTSVLYYGFKADGRDPFTCPLQADSFSSYYRCEDTFRGSPPVNAPTTPYLATMITGETLADAVAVVDSGVASDGTFPTNRPVILEKTSDTGRNVRFNNFDNAVFNLRLRGNVVVIRTNSDVTTGLTNVLGFQTGLANFALTGTQFVPGAAADNLTSFGGYILEGGLGQTTLLEFLKAGAAGSYGTVTEPCNYLAKFPSPMNHFYQARGFSMAEGYYQAVNSPYQGIVVAEPLAAPFRESLSIAWSGLSSNTVLTGTTNLSLLVSSTSIRRPVQRVDLFVDGKLLSTLTNIAPTAGNTLTATIAGRAISYTVPGGASLASLALGMSNAINASPNPLRTGAEAFATRGDRIELHALSQSSAGSAFPTETASSQGSGSRLTTYLWAARTNFLDSVAQDGDPDDLVARNHLFVTAGVTNLALTFPLNTSALPDGMHELTAVAYEGTSVNTQSRVSLPVWVQNSPLTAVLTLTGADDFCALETNFTATVSASGTNIALIELFTTGGRFASATNQSTATFTLDGSFLGPGLHPVYGLVTTADGIRYRTAARQVRVLGQENSILAEMLPATPPIVAWKGIAGRRYEILGTDDLALPFASLSTVTASNSAVNIWRDGLVSPGQSRRFYRVTVAP